jgi:hypothetical protein
MTTHPLITCFILSALCFCSCSWIDTEPGQRIVRVKALADPALRERNPRWDQEVRGLVQASSDYFEREFGIRFITQSTAAWPSDRRLPSTAALLTLVKQEFPLAGPNESYDLIIAFSAERMNLYRGYGGRARVDRIGNCRNGLARYVVSTISEPFRYAGVSAEPSIDVIALVHELGHVFGAEHVDDRHSIMHENFDYRSEFDLKNRSVILNNKDCPFAR